jgi:uncharacterized protein (DUF1684 family)
MSFKQCTFVSVMLLIWLLPIGLAAQTGYVQEIQEHREAYRQKFLQLENGPLRPEGVARLQFFEPDSSYRVTARFLQTPNQEPFDMPTYSGITRPYVKYGELHFELQGQACTLAVYQNLQLRQNPLYRDYLFLPFKDHSNGEESYGGGRYLDLRLGEIDEETQTYLLDFNRCYNPYCAYSDGYSCPIPPSENHLPLPVLAGERAFE